MRQADSRACDGISHIAGAEQLTSLADRDAEDEFRSWASHRHVEKTTGIDAASNSSSDEGNENAEHDSEPYNLEMDTAPEDSSFLAGEKKAGDTQVHRAAALSSASDSDSERGIDSPATSSESDGEKLHAFNAVDDMESSQSDSDGEPADSQ